METTRGKLGLTIPTQTLSRSQSIDLSPEAILAWRNHLPMADLGNSAKQVYHVLDECNQVKLEFNDRYEILELCRPPVQYICQSLRKHYINQPTPLNEQQLTITKLAETLQLEMAYGYKLLLEQYAENPRITKDESKIPNIIQRIIYYFNNILFRSYNIYAPPPKDIWAELHSVFRFAEDKKIENQAGILDFYKQTLILAASIPLKWRQSEQEGLYATIPKWTRYVDLKKNPKPTEEIGIFLVDLFKNLPPMAMTRGQITPGDNTRVLDFSNLVKHIKGVLAEVEPNELKARMAHSDEVEYTITTPVFRGLLKEWGTITVRKQERLPEEKTIQICLGLSATHFYLNHEKPFESSDKGVFGALPTFGIQEEIQEESQSQKILSYPSYTCKIQKVSPLGYLINCTEMQYLTVQPGELIGIYEQKGDKAIWEIGMIRWLEHPSAHEIKMGINRLSEHAKPGKVQLIKEGQPAGYYLRCFVFDNFIITPPIPFKVSNLVSVLIEDNTSQSRESMELELTELYDVTSSFKQFYYVKKEKESIKEKTGEMVSSSDSNTIDLDKSPSATEGFEDIWTKL